MGHQSRIPDSSGYAPEREHMLFMATLRMDEGRDVVIVVPNVRAESEVRRAARRLDPSLEFVRFALPSGTGADEFDEHGVNMGPRYTAANLRGLHDKTAVLVDPSWDVEANEIQKRDMASALAEHLAFCSQFRGV